MAWPIGNKYGVGSAGRPSSYQPVYAEQARKLYALAATDVQVADFLGISLTTLHRWAATEHGFQTARKLGREESDENVVTSLYHRAVGYTYDAEKIYPPRGRSRTALRVPYREHVPPDTTAQIFWLKNRRPGEWRDQRHLQMSHEYAGCEDAAQVIEAVRAQLGDEFAERVLAVLDAPLQIDAQALPDSAGEPGASDSPDDTAAQ